MTRLSLICCSLLLWPRPLMLNAIKEEHVAPCAYRRQNKLNDVRQGVDKFLVT